MDAADPSSTVPLIRTARVRRPHGVHGAVRVESFGGDVRRFHRGLRLVPEVEPRALRGSPGERLPALLTVLSARELGDGDLLLRFEEIASPEAAAPLRGAYLSVPAGQARPLAAGEWFVWQLVGLTAVDRGGAEIGRVRDVESGPAHDVLVVDTPSGERRFPMVSAFVAEVSPEQGRMVLTPWEEDTGAV